MKKGSAFFLVIAIVISLVLIDQPVFAKTKTNFVIEKDGSILLPSQKNKTKTVSNFTNAPLSNPEWKDFFNANGKWSVMIDKTTMTPFRAFGKPIQIENVSNITNDNVQSASMQFLNVNSAVLNINPSNLKLTKAKKVNKLWYVGYKQVYEGLEVLTSGVELRIRDDGKVTAFKVEYYNNINISTTPTVPLQKAMETASVGLKYNIKKDVTQSEGKTYILPVKNKGKVDFKLVYDIKVETKQPLGFYNSFVDAHSGNIVWRINKVCEINTTVNVKGMVKDKYSYQTEQLKSFPHQYVNIGTERNVADENGVFTKDVPSLNSISAKMQGTWAKVSYMDFYGNESDTAYYESSLTPGANFALNWNNNNSDIKERMLYYHATYIHDYLKNLDSSFHGLDKQVNLYIQASFSPNAGAAGSDIYFQEPYLPEYKFTETPSILYHEYTHNVNYQLYDKINGTVDVGMLNLTCNEATADVGSALMIDDEMIGRGAFASDSNKNIRTLNNINIYPDSIDGESHHDGQILSGAFWDFKKLTSRDIVEKVSHFAKYGTPDNLDVGLAFNDWFFETIVSDDNQGSGDNDLSNGTPHLSEICTAFNMHHIGTDLAMVISFEHTPLEDTKNITEPYLVEFNLKSEPNYLNSHPDSVYIVYSIDNMKTLNLIPAIKVISNDPLDTKYKAEIPALPTGTMVKYYIHAKESVSGRNFKFTVDYPDFTPYQFLIGYDTFVKEEFEIENNWSVGSPDDNASNGVWERAVPKDESIENGDNIDTLQPGEDHSINGNKCFVTGSNVFIDRPIRTSNFFEYLNDVQSALQGMPNGTTTLISGLYDLSHVTNPIVRYFRWFTNEFWNLFELPNPENGSLFIFSISSNAGSSWIPVDTLNTSTWGWYKILVKIDDYVKLTNRMRFKFTVLPIINSQSVPYTMTEGIVDDFEILIPGTVAPPSVMADFGASPLSGVAPLAVQFSDSSKGNPNSWWWDFGDGKNSSEKNPLHIYNNTGSYRVTLTASNADNQDTESKDKYINVISIQGEFSATPLEGIQPLEVQFTDHTKGTATSWLWDFGDGETSPEQSPKHTYTDAGIYTVILIVKNQEDSSVVSKNDYISVYELFGASFSADTNSGLIPLTVNFTDLSFGNPISWTWNFGDGGTSQQQNPSHVYTVQGIYNVSLTVSDGSQNSTKTKNDFISAYNTISVEDEDSHSAISVYPNPFSSSTAIYYELSEPEHVSLRIYDLMGNLITTLVDEGQSEGRKFAVWNGIQSDGIKSNQGMYIYRLNVGNKTYSGKMILY
ncbi:MAG: PKD domain-containing protein [Ignavibacteriae bacterium]|nr:PKD domain-containing protein [Ignavibacteriota bacterium]